LIDRANWQRKLHFYLFGGQRSRANSVYSQQYVGNLQLIRRLFLISWTSDNTAPFLRRKIALDQGTFDKQKTIFEHEELGKALPLKNKNRQKNISYSINSRDTNWEKYMTTDPLISKNRFFPDYRVEAKPLYAGWDFQQHALILCNRFLPSEWAIRTKIFDIYKTTTLPHSTMLLKNLKQYHTTNHRDEFRIWPKSYRARRMRLRNVRYNRRAFVRRRSSKNRNSRMFLLAQDRSTWNRETHNRDASQFTFWFNPRSDTQRENNIRTNYPVRGSQRFPLTLERRSRPRTYTPGDLQPSSRGGLVWPGNEFFVFPQKN
jgi:hypothetical protein